VHVLMPDLPGISMRLSEEALITGAVYPERVFPDLATTAYTFHVAVTAAGYADATLTVNIPIGATFPITVSPLLVHPRNLAQPDPAEVIPWSGAPILGHP
jgi:hypothetical protein